jgi:hypothetical protein
LLLSRLELLHHGHVSGPLYGSRILRLTHLDIHMT